MTPLPDILRCFAECCRKRILHAVAILIPFFFSFSQNLHHRIVVFRPMREGTITAHFDPLSGYFPIGGITRTVRSGVQRTIAEQTVQFAQSLMTGKIFTGSVFKKTIGIIHKQYTSFPGISARSIFIISVNSFFCSILTQKHNAPQFLPR